MHEVSFTPDHYETYAINIVGHRGPKNKASDSMPHQTKVNITPLVIFTCQITISKILSFQTLVTIIWFFLFILPMQQCTYFSCRAQVLHLNVCSVTNKNRMGERIWKLMSKYINILSHLIIVS